MASAKPLCSCWGIQRCIDSAELGPTKHQLSFPFFFFFGRALGREATLPNSKSQNYRMRGLDVVVVPLPSLCLRVFLIQQTFHRLHAGGSILGLQLHEALTHQKNAKCSWRQECPKNAVACTCPAHKRRESHQLHRQSGSTGWQPHFPTNETH